MSHWTDYISEYDAYLPSTYESINDYSVIGPAFAWWISEQTGQEFDIDYNLFASVTPHDFVEFFSPLIGGTEIFSKEDALREILEYYKHFSMDWNLHRESRQMAVHKLPETGLPEDDSTIDGVAAIFGHGTLDSNHTFVPKGRRLVMFTPNGKILRTDEMYRLLLYRDFSTAEQLSAGDTFTNIKLTPLSDDEIKEDEHYMILAAGTPYTAGRSIPVSAICSDPNKCWKYVERQGAWLHSPDCTGIFNVVTEEYILFYGCRADTKAQKLGTNPPRNVEQERIHDYIVAAYEQFIEEVRVNPLSAYIKLCAMNQATASAILSQDKNLLYSVRESPRISPTADQLSAALRLLHASKDEVRARVMRSSTWRFLVTWHESTDYRRKLVELLHNLRSKVGTVSDWTPQKSDSSEYEYDSSDIVTSWNESDVEDEGDESASLNESDDIYESADKETGSSATFLKLILDAKIESLCDDLNPPYEGMTRVDLGNTINVRAKDAQQLIKEIQAQLDLIDEWILSIRK
ncbi:putative adhesin [Amycolatopsis australiensis]|uniref:Putative adhesin Stv domain-containing protein n=1 Tax=Amycolatopsis australiensis TaxID=546364 RepID=A0A1K1SXK8_9PSEU|nr:hypothetical protein [Amycolatopsis australiensis]SFW88597.1 hypothetical protein SAMN04489730_7009 [Amycolatopsis australiensis]